MRHLWVGLAGVAIVAMFLASGWPIGGASAVSPDPRSLVSSSITAGFNSFNIPSGDTIWFTAVAQLVGFTPTGNLHIEMFNQTLTFAEPSGTTFVRHLPTSKLTFSPTATVASTSWVQTPASSGSGIPGWFTTVPVKSSGNAFLAGYAYYVGSGGIPGGTKITWSATFAGSATPLCYFKINWQWGAAVYTQFAGSGARSNNYPFTTANYANVGVKPTDDNKASSYQNSDHAGTPENYTSYLAQGGTGGGGSNYTGSYSATASVTKPECF